LKGSSRGLTVIQSHHLTARTYVNLSQDSRRPDRESKRISSDKSLECHSYSHLSGSFDNREPKYEERMSCPTQYFVNININHCGVFLGVYSLTAGLS